MAQWLHTRAQFNGSHTRSIKTKNFKQKKEMKDISHGLHIQSTGATSRCLKKLQPNKNDHLNRWLTHTAIQRDIDNGYYMN